MCASGAVQTKKQSRVWHKEAESDGFILAKGVGGHSNGHSRGIHASLLMCLCVSLSVSQPAAPQPVSTPQYGSNLEIGSTTNKSELQRGEQRQEGRGGRRE